MFASIAQDTKYSIQNFFYIKLRINHLGLLLLLFFLYPAFFGGGRLFAQTNGLLFTVNDVADTADASVGDGICADAVGRCTLRAAVEESNATAARDAIIFNLPQPSIINLTLGELTINYSLDIVGPGARRLTVQRSTAAGTPNFRIFHVPPGQISFNIRGLTIRNGNDLSGGAMLIEPGGVAGLYDSAVIGNRAVGGGAIAVNQSRLTVLRTLVSSNLADTSGGGINITDSASNVTITCSTLTGNSASYGGAMNNEGALILINNTISQNAASASSSSIFSNASGSIKALNTIIGRDTAQPASALKGQFISLGNNIVTDARNSIGFTNGVNSDQVSDNNAIDPMLGNLADNGGQSDTLAVLSGSPAINLANPCVLNGICSQLPGVFIRGSLDQRGYLRPNLFSNETEIGAFEQVGPIIAIRLGTVGVLFTSAFNPLSRFARSPVILTNARTLEKQYSTLKLNGSVLFPGVRRDDVYIVEIKTKRNGLPTPLVFAFD